MNYIFDIKEGDYTYKDRIYKIFDKKGEFLWYEWTQKIVNSNEEGSADCCISDFQNGDWLGLTQEEKDKALKRVAKLN